MDKETFEKLAAFNKLRMTPEEEAVCYGEILARLAELEPLTGAEMGDTPIMVWAQGVAPVYREDTVEQAVSREEILAQAPEQAEHCFAVPRVAD